MKVLFINSVAGIRSTGRICTDLADVLLSQGHDCRLAYGRERIPDKYKKISYRIEGGFANKIDYLMSLLFSSAGFNSYLGTKRFLKWIDSFKPDLIHIHNLHGFYINIGLLFKYIKKRKIPIVITLHDSWLFTGHCTYFEYVKCYKWQKKCHKCPQRKRYPYGLLFDNSSAIFEKKKELLLGVENIHLVTPSRWLYNLTKKSFLKDLPTTVIHNGVDSSCFNNNNKILSRQKCNLPLDKYIILGVASTWDKGKGLYDFYELSQRLPNNFQIVLIGLTPKQINDLPNNIIGINKTNDVSELCSYYSSADVFLNLTYEDNYPTVNIESQLCGTPCLTYDTGGSIESVPANNIFKQGDLDGIIMAIQKKLNDNNNFAILNRKDFDKNHSFAEYLDLYNSIISEE